MLAPVGVVKIKGLIVQPSIRKIKRHKQMLAPVGGIELPQGRSLAAVADNKVLIDIRMLVKHRFVMFKNCLIQ